MNKDSQTNTTAIDANTKLCRVFSFKITGQNYFDWYCCKDWDLKILFIYISCHGFKRQVLRYPTASKCFIVIYILGLRLTFRIGKQQSTWFYVRNEELYGLRVRLINRFRQPF